VARQDAHAASARRRSPASTDRGRRGTRTGRVALSAARA
jgi:hypothetical protein